jgi:hypothetical protein
LGTGAAVGATGRAIVDGIGFAVDVVASKEIDVAVGVAARVGRGVDVIDAVTSAGR